MKGSDMKHNAKTKQFAALGIFGPCLLSFVSPAFAGGQKSAKLFGEIEDYEGWLGRVQYSFFSLTLQTRGRLCRDNYGRSRQTGAGRFFWE